MIWLWFEWRSGARQQAQLEGLPFAGEALTWSGRVRGLRLTEASDSDIDKLAELELPDLRQLQLTDCSITLKGLQTVASLGPLVELNLRGTPLPKEAVDVLLRIPTLEKLDVTRCGLPLEGVQRLEKEVPGLRIAS
jgi:hypothetical protein